MKKFICFILTVLLIGAYSGTNKAQCNALNNAETQLLNGNEGLITANDNEESNGNKVNFTLGAKSAVIMDAASGEIVFSNNEKERLPIASMTKIMLCNLIFDEVEQNRLALTDTVTVSQRAASFGGSQVFLQAGKDYQVNDLLKSIVIASANDASVALAERIFGSEDACVDRMNSKAKEMKLENTLFSNCTGLPKPTQYSCANDVAVMLKELVSHQNYFEFSSIWLDKLTHPDGSETVLTNTNKLVRFYKGCDGGKTGFTSEAAFCLAATAKRGALRLISVVIGEESSKERFRDVSEMFDYGFSNFVSRMIVDGTRCLEQSVKVKRGKVESVMPIPSESYFAFENKNEKHNYTVEFTEKSDLCAPIAQGETVGEIIIFKDNIECCRINAVAQNAVEKSNLLDSLDSVMDNWKIA